MTERTITLSEPLDAFVEEQVRTGRHQSASGVVGEALRRYQEDLAAERANLRSAEISALGTKNGLLPTLAAIGGETDAGLSGDPQPVVQNGHVLRPDPYFVGGVTTAVVLPGSASPIGPRTRPFGDPRCTFHSATPSKNLSVAARVRRA